MTRCGSSSVGVSPYLMQPAIIEMARCKCRECSRSDQLPGAQAAQNTTAHYAAVHNTIASRCPKYSIVVPSGNKKIQLFSGDAASAAANDAAIAMGVDQCNSFIELLSVLDPGLFVPNVFVMFFHKIMR